MVSFVVDTVNQGAADVMPPEPPGDRLKNIAAAVTMTATPGSCREHFRMCRNIKTLANFAPPATEDEIRASALQFVRKLSGASRPSRANEAAFNRAVDDVAAAANRLIHSLTTSAPPRNREDEARKAQERARERYAVASR
jgi:hypothetical protein